MTFNHVGSEVMNTRKGRRTELFARELLIFLRRQLESPVWKARGLSFQK